MSITSQKEENLKNPKKELATAFFGEGNGPFRRAVIGVTFPFAEYRIKREAGHRTTVMEYVLSGEGEILLDGEWQRVTAGDAYILRSGEPHHYRACPQNPFLKLWINYAAEYFPAFLDAYGIGSGIYRVKELEPLFRRLYSFTEREGDFKSIHLDIAATVHEIIHTLLAARQGDRSDAHLIKEALHASLYERLNLDALAEELHLSKSSLIRIFKKEFHTTPYEYLLSLKISTARLLLRDTNMTVKEIAARLQITDEHYFSSVFLARVGERPRAYRMRHKS